MVAEGSRTVAEVAREFGIHDTTLGNWVRVYKYRHDAEKTPSLSGSERGRLREPERENRELREKVQFLKKPLRDRVVGTTPQHRVDQRRRCDRDPGQDR